MTQQAALQYANAIITALFYCVVVKQGDPTRRVLLETYVDK